MKYPSRKPLTMVLMSAAMAITLLAGAAWAQPEKIDVKVGGKSIAVESKDIRIGDIYVAKNDTFDGDLVAKGGSVTVDGVVDGDCVAFGGSMVVNGEVLGGMAIFGGAAQVNGRISKDLAAFGGPVTVTGTIGGDLASFGGLVSLLSSAMIEGDIAVMDGQLDKAEGAVVKGDIKNISLGMMNQFLPSAIHVVQKTRPYARVLPFLIALAWVLAFALLILLISLFFPLPVERIARSIELDVWKSIGIGLLAQMVFFPTLVMMAVSILGIPLIPLAILAFIAASVLGFAGFCLLAAKRLFALAHRPPPRTMALAMLSFLALNLLMLVGHLINIPGAPFTILGWTLIITNYSVLWFAVTVGLGAVWSTRFGSRNEATRPAPVVTP